MGLRVQLTNKFKKHFAKMNERERKSIRKALRLLETDPMYPSLRLKGIKAHLGLFECSANMDIRILWRYKGDKIILVLDVGHHDILKNLKKY